MLGDVAFFGCCTTPEYFSEVADYLSRFDMVVGNLETPFSMKKITHGAKSAYICSDVENIGLLKQLHVKAVTLANNHIFDFGKEGYETTKQVLSEGGIEYFGCEGRCYNIDYEDNHLSFEGFCCYSTNPLQVVEYGSYGVNKYNLAKTEEVLSKHDAEGRLTVLAVHAGLEHVNYPSLDHVKAARMLAKKHKYIYYGHHPHVAQGIECINGSLVAYSLGNFCFDNVWTSASSEKPLIELTENNRTSFILEINVEHNEVVSYDVTSIYIGQDRIKIDHCVTREMLEEYMEPVDKITSVEYEQMRKQVLDARYAERRNARDLMWYLKRVRLRYVKLIIDGKINAYKYRKNVKAFID